MIKRKETDIDNIEKYDTVTQVAFNGDNLDKVPVGV